MADIDKLIKTILSDSKFATSVNFASRVYQDEPIIFTAAQMEQHTPSKYRAMRKIAGSSALYRASEAQIFCEQGRFMADFEDEFDYQGGFSRYFPTYQAMNDQQLRGYFSWRTKVRRGAVEPTSLSFVYVYIYELLNQIGVNSPEDGFHSLKNFWLIYREINEQIDHYVKMWFKDYVIYYNLEKSWLEEFSETETDQAVLTLLNHKSHDAEEVFSALNALSSYNLENSRFFKEHPGDLKEVACEVFSSLSDHYGKNCKNTLCDKLFGKTYTSSYSMFKSAVFYSSRALNDFIYEISDIHKYTYKNGSWSCERFFRYGDNNKQIGALLKTIDFLMRQKYDFKSTLKAGKTTKILSGLINKTIDKYQEQRRAQNRPKIEIDLSKLKNIRQAALKIQKRLIIEEPAITETLEFFKLSGPLTPPSAEPMGNSRTPTEKSPEQVTTEAAKNQTRLSSIECGFLSRLLNGQTYDDLLRPTGLMLSVLVEAVNEKLYDSFGDTVIIEAGGRPELVEDYIDELKEIIRP